jgi:hypothetical protein
MRLRLLAFDQALRALMPLSPDRCPPRATAVVARARLVSENSQLTHAQAHAALDRIELHYFVLSGPWHCLMTFDRDLEKELRLNF